MAKEDKETGKLGGLTPARTRALMALVAVITAIAIWLVPVDEKEAPPSLPELPSAQGTAEPLPPGQVGDRDTRYPRITLDEVVERDPSLVLLPDEPHKFTTDDAAVFAGLDIGAARRNAVTLCSGRDLFWYGAMSVDGLGRLRRLIAELRAQ